jgi:SAM-dependent methyltransferase
VTPTVADFDPGWLAAREPADRAARAAALVGLVPRPDGELVVHDLGCGTGSQARWLAPLLPGPQAWVLHDRDPALLDLAARATAGLAAADGRPVRVRTARTDLAALTAADLAGADLVTASALLDLLTPAQLDALVVACAGRPVLWTLSVTGQVALDPADPLDDPLTAAFDAHQRRGGLLGPDAPGAAQAALARRGWAVRVADSPWRLGPQDPDQHPDLLPAWLRGRVSAAVEQEPGLADAAARWLRDRLAAATAGRLRATVGHQDLLAVPPGGIPGKARPAAPGSRPGQARHVGSGDDETGGSGQPGAPPEEVAT